MAASAFSSDESHFVDCHFPDDAAFEASQACLLGSFDGDEVVFRAFGILQADSYVERCLEVVTGVELLER